MLAKLKHNLIYHSRSTKKDYRFGVLFLCFVFFFFLSDHFACRAGRMVSRLALGSHSGGSCSFDLPLDIGGRRRSVIVPFPELLH